jgi:endonuclease YncB( thermonuclease family)
MALRLVALGLAVILSASEALPQASAAATMLEGTATVIDGDTIEIHGQRIRLDAIDAPESRQRCQAADGAPYPCGRRAAFALADRIGRAPVQCVAKGRDRYGRIIAVCFTAGTNLNGWMVEQGWAVAFRRYGNDYIPQEDRARTHRRGIWAGRFDMPWDWRQQNR